MTDCQFVKDQRVVYVPRHGGNDLHHPDAETGKFVRVSNYDPTMAMVWFDNTPTPKLTPIARLYPIPKGGL